jgi:hypothetical protein
MKALPSAHSNHQETARTNRALTKAQTLAEQGQRAARSPPQTTGPMTQAQHPPRRAGPPQAISPSTVSNMPLTLTTLASSLSKNEFQFCPENTNKRSTCLEQPILPPPGPRLTELMCTHQLNPSGHQKPARANWCTIASSSSTYRGTTHQTTQQQGRHWQAKCTTHKPSRMPTWDRRALLPLPWTGQASRAPGPRKT